MASFWPRVGERPETTELGERAAAEVLLRAGVLTGWLAAAGRPARGQDTAKDLIGESLSTFERLRLKDKAAEAQSELAYCYWREGALDEARVLLQEALDRFGDGGGEANAVALLRKALVENAAMRFDDSLGILLEAAPIFEASTNHALKGRFHNELAYNFQRLASARNRTDYIDRALVEYTAASFHFEQAGHVRYQAHVENNLGLLLYELDKFDDSHEHLDRAWRLFNDLGDGLYLAQTNETRARVLLAQGRAAEAEETARDAVRAFEKAGEGALLAEALPTHAKALAQLGRFDEARAAFELAAATAVQAGSTESAGLSLLMLIEALGQQLGAEELRSSYRRADEMLARSQQPEIFLRLRQAARYVLDSQPETVESPAPASAMPPVDVSLSEGAQTAVENLIESAHKQYRKQVEFTPEAIGAIRRFFLKENLQTLSSLIERTVAAASTGALITADAVEVVAMRRSAPHGNFAQPWADFSLKDEISQPEKRFIELALKAADGKISVAARLLGFNHNELLTSIIKTRYPDLLSARRPVIPRKRSIISKTRRRD
jgi:tetratricopeptide (TPR) repeat protein